MNIPAKKIVGNKLRTIRTIPFAVFFDLRKDIPVISPNKGIKSENKIKTKYLNPLIKTFAVLRIPP